MDSSQALSQPSPWLDDLSINSRTLEIEAPLSPNLGSVVDVDVLILLVVGEESRGNSLSLAFKSELDHLRPIIKYETP